MEMLLADKTKFGNVCFELLLAYSIITNNRKFAMQIMTMKNIFISTLLLIPAILWCSSSLRAKKVTNKYVKRKRIDCFTHTQKKTEQSRDVHQRSIVNQQTVLLVCWERDNRRWRLCHACLHCTMRRGDCYRSKEAACSTRGTLLRPISFNQPVSRRMSGCILCLYIFNEL